MPAARELVSNRPLLGSDLAKIIESDLHALLEGDGMLSNHCAYGRVSYELRVTLHMDNPAFPLAKTAVTSKRRADDLIEKQPELAAIEGPPPLSSPSTESYASSVERHRDIESPNLARAEFGLPVTVVRRSDGGGTVEEQVKYPPESVEGIAPQPVDTDLTRITRQEWAQADAAK